MAEQTKALFAIDQAHVALGVAGLSVDNIFRVELEEARVALAELVAKAEAVASTRWAGLTPAKAAALSDLRAALAAVRGGANHA